MSYDPRDISILVTLFRLLHCWDQSGMAAEATLPPSSISNYERGKKVPQAETIERLAAAAHVPMWVVEGVAHNEARVFSSPCGRAALFGDGVCPGN